MQDVTEKICTNTAEGFEKQLKDTRDGQLYWVGRMKDGRCWMLQNLALGSTSSATTLTSANSDVSSSWSLPALKTSPSGTASNTAIQSWNLGKWVLATPLLTAGCGNTTAGQSLSNCIKVGFVDVSSSSFQPTYTATTRSWEGANSTSSTLVAVNCTTWSGSGNSKTCTAGTYDPHYLVGNYYSWNAATAGTGGSKTSSEATDSICPKGWELPYIVPSGGLMGTKEFGTLLAAYGVDSSLSGTPIGGTTTYNIAGAPLRFVRGGLVSVGGGYAYYVGQTGSYWSRISTSAADKAYRLSFNASKTSVADSGTRYNGMSVRCVTHWTYSGGTLIPIN